MPMSTSLRSVAVLSVLLKYASGRPAFARLVLRGHLLRLTTTACEKSELGRGIFEG